MKVTIGVLITADMRFPSNWSVQVIPFSFISVSTVAVGLINEVARKHFNPVKSEACLSLNRWGKCWDPTYRFKAEWCSGSVLGGLHRPYQQFSLTWNNLLLSMCVQLWYTFRSGIISFFLSLCSASTAFLSHAGVQSVWLAHLMQLRMCADIEEVENIDMQYHWEILAFAQLSDSGLPWSSNAQACVKVSTRINNTLCHGDKWRLWHVRGQSPTCVVFSHRHKSIFLFRLDGASWNVWVAVATTIVQALPSIIGNTALLNEFCWKQAMWKERLQF